MHLLWSSSVLFIAESLAHRWKLISACVKQSWQWSPSYMRDFPNVCENTFSLIGVLKCREQSNLSSSHFQQAEMQSLRLVLEDASVLHKSVNLVAHIEYVLSSSYCISNSFIPFLWDKGSCGSHCPNWSEWSFAKIPIFTFTRWCDVDRLTDGQINVWIKDRHRFEWSAECHFSFYTYTG